MASRFGPLRMIDGVAFTAKNDSVANLGTLGDGRNSPHSSIVATNHSPTPPFEYAAHVAGVAALYGNADPARPFQTLSLSWVKAPAESDLFTIEERNLLLFDGISTTRVAAGGVVQIERLCTTYKTNAAGSADTSYYDVTTMLTLLYARYSFRNKLQTKYPRHKVANDGVRVGAGQAVVTPKSLKAEALLWFRELESLGLFENFDQFKTDLVVERNEIDPNRVDFLLPPDLINQFVIGAAKIQHRL
jgi:phage tail sheath gpL-like